MKSHTKTELEQALFAVSSTLGKSEKALAKLRPGTHHHTATGEAIRAYRIALELLERALHPAPGRGTGWRAYTTEEMDGALKAVATATARVERVLPKLKPGSPQHTLALRRVQAFGIAAQLMEKEEQALAAAQRGERA